MMVSYIREAWRTLLQYRRLWYGLFGLKFVLALVITVPALIVVQADVDYSTFARQLLDSWSIDVIAEIILTKANVLSTGLAVLAVFSILVFLIKQFLNGGIYRTIWSHAPLERERFFGWSALHFSDHLMISFGMLFIYGVLLLLGTAVASFTGFLVRQLESGIPLIGVAVRVATVYFFIILGVVYSDIVRLRKSARPDEPLPKSFKEAFGVYRRHIVQLVGIYLAFFVPFVIIWLAMEGLALVVTDGLENMIGVVLELLFFQFCAFLRVGQGLMATAGMASVVRNKTRPFTIPSHQEATVD